MAHSIFVESCEEDGGMMSGRFGRKPVKEGEQSISLQAGAHLQHRLPLLIRQSSATIIIHACTSFGHYLLQEKELWQ